jgi:hypothetical protein
MSPELLDKLATAILIDGVKRGARTIEMIDTGFQVRLMYFAREMWVEGWDLPEKLQVPVVKTLARMASIDPEYQLDGSFDLIIGEDKARYHFDLELHGPRTFRIQVDRVGERTRFASGTSPP